MTKDERNLRCTGRSRRLPAQQRRRFAPAWIVFVALQACAAKSPRVIVGNGFVSVTDPPVYRFRNVGWDYGNITNPVILTRNRFNHSLISVLRVREGETLGRGTTVFTPGMSMDDIRALVLENLKGRARIEDVVTGTATVAGTDAVSAHYRDVSSSQARRGREYAFVSDRTLFHLIFLVDEGPALSEMLDDYQQVVTTFSVGK